MTVRGGGVVAGATTVATIVATMGSTVFMPPSSAPRLSQVVIVSQWRWWHSTPGEARHTREEARLAREVAQPREGGWGR
jgi:hypothetical protein